VGMSSSPLPLPMSPAESFGLVLRQLRMEAKLSQENFAFEAELERNFISLLERTRQTPSLNTVFKIAKAFGMKPSALIALVEANCE
jgi:transcriptional regulator with XRE-family HTH domain